MSLCSKPNCARPGSVVLAYDYAARTAVLEDPTDGELSPHVYALCSACAEKLQPPRGWTLLDRRRSSPLFFDAPARTPARVAAVDRHAEESRKARQIFFGYSA